MNVLLIADSFKVADSFINEHLCFSETYTSSVTDFAGTYFVVKYNDIDNIVSFQIIKYVKLLFEVLM